MKKTIICLLMLGGTFQISGMGYITSLLQRGQAIPIDYDKQLQDAVASCFVATFFISGSHKVNLAINALENGAKPDLIVPRCDGSRLVGHIIERYKEPHLKPLFDALIRAKANVNLRNVRHVPPLGKALNAITESSEMKPADEERLYYYIDSLLKAGALITDTIGLPSYTSIFFFAVVSKGFDRVLKMMIDAGAPINMCNGIAGTPLLWAVLRGNESAVKILLAAGVSVLQKDDLGQNVLEAIQEDESDFYRDSTRLINGRRRIAELLQKTIDCRTLKRAALLKILLDEEPVKLGDKSGQQKDAMLDEEPTNAEKKPVKQKSFISTFPRDILGIIVTHTVII